MRIGLLLLGLLIGVAGAATSRVPPTSKLADIPVDESVILLGQLEGFSANETLPSVVQVRMIDSPSIGVGKWIEEVLVEEDGSFRYPLYDWPKSVLVEFVAPPWSWLALIRSDESAVLHLSPPSQSSNRLTGVNGKVRWEGAHPTAELDSLSRLQSQLLSELKLELFLMQSGSGGADSVVDALTRADERFEAAWSDGHLKDSDCSDLWWKARLDWNASMGKSLAHLDSLWIVWNRTRIDQTWEQKLQTPGWFDGWIVREDGWWKRRDVSATGLQEAVFYADLDSLRSAMGPRWKTAELESLAAAWLIKAIFDPDELTGRIWETMAFPEVFRDVYKKLQKDRAIGTSGFEPLNIRWTMPNGDLDSLQGICSGHWTVLLIVRNQSGMASREREMFGELASNRAYRDICWIVVSADLTETEWRTTLSQRRRIDEQIVWIGRNQMNYEALGLRSIPQVVICSPQGTLVDSPMLLPSAGLEREVRQLVRQFQRNY